VAGSESVRRALIVDGDPAIRRLLQSLLKLEGLESDQASDAQIAHSLIQKSIYSLLLIDLRLPGPSGIDLIRALRARGNAIPILIVSSDLGTLSKEELESWGRVACVAKPFDTVKLRVAVRNLSG
jgi:two-component system, OmpR family, response regulator VanR